MYSVIENIAVPPGVDFFLSLNISFSVVFGKLKTRKCSAAAKPANQGQDSSVVAQTSGVNGVE